MKRMFDFINKFRSLEAETWNFAEAVQSDVFDFLAVTKTGRTIPTYGSCCFDCNKIINPEPLKPIKVIRHRKDTTSITIQYEKIGYVRFWFKSIM